MSNYTFCPVIPHEGYFAVFNNSPTGEKRLERFRATIHILTDTESTVQVLWRDDELCGGSTSWDYKGYASSVGDQVGYAIERVKELEPTSHLRVRVMTTITTKPIKISKREPFYRRAVEYNSFDTAWYEGNDERFVRYRVVRGQR